MLSASMTVAGPLDCPVLPSRSVQAVPAQTAPISAMACATLMDA
jgi:hypothetical protein